MNNIKQYLIYTAIALAGIVIGSLLFGGDSEPKTLDQHIAENHTDEAGNILYTCSMHPSVRQEEPGNCPICGMELIPVENEGATTDPDALVMTQAAMKLAEIETTPVRSGNPVAKLRLPGRITVDEQKTSAVTAHIPGRIIDLYVDFEGEFVKKGDRLASIYSPKLISAQQELLETLQYKDQNPVLYNAARKKLELLEIPVSTINEIEETKMIMETVDIISPADGFVQEIRVSRQEHVMEGAIMYHVANLSSVWAIFHSFESNLSVLKEGQDVEFTTTSYPGRTFTGQIDYVYPTVDANSRSMDIRVEVMNPNSLLKPNMLIEGVIEAPVSNRNSLLLPMSAVMWTGTRSIVFVKDPNTTEPTFQAREVSLGSRIGDYYVVAEGLEAGEEVVTNGTFKLDSAAQLADKLSMMNREPGTGANRTGHEGHTMNMESPEAAQPAANDNHQEHNDPIPDEFQEQVKTVITHYLDLKNALVRSDAGAASGYSKDLLSSLEEVDMSLVKGDLHTTWMEYLNGMNQNSMTISASEDIAEQRKAFISLSDLMIKTVKTYEIPGVIYQQFCPMANSGAGATWLSSEDAVANPYYGDMMHNCGEVVTKIEY